MQNGRDSEDLLRRYLLGQLEWEEQERLERQMLIDDERFEELSVAEDELIDSYICGALSEPERERFREHFLAAPERKQKLSFSESLHQYVNAATVAEALTESDNRRPRPALLRFLPASLKPHNPLLGFSLAATFAIVIVSASLLIVRNVLRQPTEGPNAPTVAVTLKPGVVRDSGEIERVTIAPEISTVRLQLELARDEHQSYNAVVETDEGREVYSADKLKPETTANVRMIILGVRARLLMRGDYQVKLGGLDSGGRFEEVGKYHFRVVATPSQP